MSDVTKRLKFGKLNIKKPPKACLPDPREIADEETAQTTTSANDEVCAVIDSPSRKRKRIEEYGKYSPEVRLKIARYCIDNGPAKTARHFTKELGRPVNESTIRNIKKSYLNSPKRDQFKTVMPRSPRGRPSKLGEKLDDMVKDYIRGLRVSGCGVNTRIIMAAARGIILHKDKKLLSEYGGQIELTKSWAASIMKRMGLSKCEAKKVINRKAKKVINREAKKVINHLPSGSEDVEKEYVGRISKAVKDNKSQSELIINNDQIRVDLVPCENLAMEETGKYILSV